MVKFFQNTTGSITWTTSTGAFQGNVLPNEEAGTGSPEPGATGAYLSIGDKITFNSAVSESTTLTGVGNQILEEGDGKNGTETKIDSSIFGQPAGTQINTDYSFNVTDGTNTYTVLALSFGVNNDDIGRDLTDMYAFVGADYPPIGTPLTVTQVENVASANFVDLLCFASGTLIETEMGPRKVEDLQVGDLVWSSRTEKAELVPIRWIGRKRVERAELEKNHKLFPVCISANALKEGVPKRDLYLSRQHRVLLDSMIVERMTGMESALIPAIMLTKFNSIYVDKKVEHVEYFHLLFDQHEIVTAEGVKAESFYTGRMALQGLSPEAREEIFTLFPELADMTDVPTARPIVDGPKGRRLIERYKKNKVVELVS